MDLFSMPFGSSMPSISASSSATSGPIYSTHDFDSDFIVNGSGQGGGLNVSPLVAALILGGIGLYLWRKSS